MHMLCQLICRVCAPFAAAPAPKVIQLVARNAWDHSALRAQGEPGELVAAQVGRLLQPGLWVK